MNPFWLKSEPNWLHRSFFCWGTHATSRVVKCYPGNRWKWSKQLFSKKPVKKKCTRTCAQTRIVKMICTRTCAQTTIVKMICARTCAQTKTVKKNCTRTCAQTKTVKKMYQNLCPNKNCKKKCTRTCAQTKTVKKNVPDPVPTYLKQHVPMSSHSLHLHMYKL